VPAPAAPPARFWGWHRLADGAARRLVADAGIRPGDLVLDLGAGTGAITRHLAATGARVLAVELHPARVAELHRRFAGCANVEVVRTDLDRLRLPTRPFRVVANPPFGLTTSVVRRLTAPRSALIRADLVVPVATAARWQRSAAGARVARRLPSHAFSPPGPPAVVLVLER